MKETHMNTASSAREFTTSEARYGEIAGTVDAYFEAIRSGDDHRLILVTADIWHGKRCGADGVTSEVLERFVKLVAAKSVQAGCYEITAILTSSADFAVVRADDWSGFTTRFLMLFKVDGRWRIATETTGSDLRRDARFQTRLTEHAVLSVLEEYYRCVTDSDGEGIRRIFGSCWHMKNHEEGVLVCEETDAFVKRLDESHCGYWDDRQISDVQIVGDRLAYVRVDRPSTPSTTVFLFARGLDGWKIIDKAWTDGRKPIT
jgi:Putative lumazine-binding